MRGGISYEAMEVWIGYDLIKCSAPDLLAAELSKNLL